MWLYHLNPYLNFRMYGHVEMEISISPDGINSIAHYAVAHGKLAGILIF